MTCLARAACQPGQRNTLIITTALIVYVVAKDEDWQLLQQTSTLLWQDGRARHVRHTGAERPKSVLGCTCLNPHYSAKGSRVQNTLSPKVTTSNSPPAVSLARISDMGLDWACKHQHNHDFKHSASRPVTPGGCKVMYMASQTTPYLAGDNVAVVYLPTSCCCEVGRRRCLLLQLSGLNPSMHLLTFLSMAHTPTLILLATPCLQSGACMHSTSAHAPCTKLRARLNMAAYMLSYKLEHF